MATADLTIILQARDNASGAMAQVNRSAAGLKSGFSSLMGSVGQMALGFMGAQVALAGLQRAISGTISAGFKFEGQMDKIRYLTSITGDEVEKVSGKLTGMAGKVGRGPNELADAFYYANSALGDADKALAAVEISAKAAALGLGDTATVVDAVTSAMNAYGLAANQVASVTDTLVAAVKYGKMPAEDLAGAIGMVLPVASAMGVSLQELVANIATLTRTGLSAHEAVTAVRAVLNVMLKESPAGAEALKKVGLSYAGLRQEIKEKGLQSALVTLTTAFKGNESGLSDVIPNVRALTDVLGTSGAQAETYANILAGVKGEAGNTEKAFQELSKTDFGFAMERFKASATAAFVGFMQKLLPGMLQGFNDLKAAIDALKPAFELLGAVISPVTIALSKLSQRDVVIVIMSIAAAITGALVAAFGAWAVAALAAFVATNLALLGIPAAIALAVGAIALLVTHWDAVWGALKAAPGALLNWLKENWQTALLVLTGPAGWLVLLVQNWGKVWSALPEPVKAALDRVGDFVEMAGNFIIGVFEDAINKVIDAFNWLADKGGDFLHAISGGLLDVDVAIGKLDLGKIGQVFENVSGEHISTMTKNAADDFMSLKKTAEETRAGLREVFIAPYGGEGGGGGGDGGAVAALTAEQEALLGLMKALDASGMSVEQFIQWQIACQNAAAWLTDAAKALDMSLEDLVDVWLRSGLAADEFGRRIEELTALVDLRDQAEDAMGAVNGLYDAFNKLYEKPTVEGAAQNLALAQLREQRATLIAGGAESDSRKVKKIDEEIASIQADIDVRRAHQEVDRAWLDVKNATFLLDKDQETMSQALIDQMGPLSTTAADFNTQLFIATWSLQELSKWFGNLASGGNDVAQRAMERYARSTEGEREALRNATPEELERLWAGGKAPSFQLGGIMPYTGWAHLEKGERVIPASRQLTAGESKRTLNFYAPITVQMPASGASLSEELEKLLR